MQLANVACLGRLRRRCFGGRLLRLSRGGDLSSACLLRASSAGASRRQGRQPCNCARRSKLHLRRCDSVRSWYSSCETNRNLTIKLRNFPVAQSVRVRPCRLKLQLVGRSYARRPEASRRCRARAAPLQSRRAARVSPPAAPPARASAARWRGRRPAAGSASQLTTTHIQLALENDCDGERAPVIVVAPKVRLSRRQLPRHV